MELSKEYLENPEGNAIDLAKYADGKDLCRTITLLIHTYTKGRKEHELDNTGKVQLPHRVAFTYTGELSFPTSVENGLHVLYVSDYFQCPESIEYMIPSPVYPQRMISTDSSYHPIRPSNPRPGTKLYSRYVPSLDETFSLQVFDDSNLQDFHEWHNSDRVNAFWNERGTIEHHREYISRQRRDPHVLPVVGYFNTQAMGYFELYWAKEDAIAKFSDNVGNYDAGFHALVGKCRGPHRVPVWISSITQFLFLRDPRTMRVVLEPRVDNAKFINYLQASGYVLEKEFNFPHKRAALMSITREKFFEGREGLCF